MDTYTPATILATLDDFDAPDADVRAALAECHTALARLADFGSEGFLLRRAREARAEFEFWAGAFERLAAAHGRPALKALATELLCQPHEFLNCRYTAAVSAMRAAVHRLQRRLCKAAGAAPTRSLANALVRALYGEIATENGETFEALEARLCA
jgi:hypothetical protein